MRAGKVVVYADDHSRPDGVHSWPETRASEVPLKTTSSLHASLAPVHHGESRIKLASSPTVNLDPRRSQRMIARDGGSAVAAKALQQMARGRWPND